MRIKQGQLGFTLMEIIVATTIFAFVVSALMAMFNYVLRINRRTEALRQATQGMRDLMEYMVKEVRNGQVDYGLNSGPNITASLNMTNYPLGACNRPTAVGVNTYHEQDNMLALRSSDGVLQCIYLAYGPDNTAGQAVGAPLANYNVFTSTAVNPKPVLAMKKSTLALANAEILTPPNVSVQRMQFLVRPLCDPYTTAPPGCAAYSNGYPKIQPTVTILAQFLVTLPTGEQTTIYYQTTVSGNKYDIPNQ